MKRLIILTCLFALGSSAWSMKKGPNINHNCVSAISMADNMFYFKSDRELLHATVDVYDYQTEKKIISQVITGKRTTIDLNGREPGYYIILITKGDFKRKYVYEKTTASQDIKITEGKTGKLNR